MLATATVLLGIGFGAAFADGGPRPVVNSYLAELPGVIAAAPVQ
jgi:hypothetical protein